LTAYSARFFRRSRFAGFSYVIITFAGNPGK
jgi:hypothetical protein